MEQYKKTRKEAGIKPATINLELATLKGMLKKAVAWRKPAEHPRQRRKGVESGKRADAFLSEEEETGYKPACSPDLRRIVEAGLLTGFRRQELVYLRPEDIDFIEGTVSVAACYSKNGESRTFPPWGND